MLQRGNQRNQRNQRNISVHQRLKKIFRKKNQRKSAQYQRSSAFQKNNQRKSVAPVTKIKKYELNSTH